MHPELQIGAASQAQAWLLPSPGLRHCAALNAFSGQMAEGLFAVIPIRSVGRERAPKENQIGALAMQILFLVMAAVNAVEVSSMRPSPWRSSTCQPLAVLPLSPCPGWRQCAGSDWGDACVGDDPKATPAMQGPW